MIEKDDLYRLLREAENQLHDRDMRIKRHRALYEMRHYEIDLSSTGSSTAQRPRKINEYSYQSNKPTNVIDLTVGMLAANELKYTAYTYNESEPSNKKAGRIEKLLASIITMNGLEQEVDIPHDIIHNSAIDGGVGVRTVWVAKGLEIKSPEVPPEPTGLAALTAKVKGFMGKTPATGPQIIGGCPIKIHVIPLENMIYLPGGDKGRWALIGFKTERAIGDIQGDFNTYRPEVVDAVARATIKVWFYDIWYWDTDETGKDRVCNAVYAGNECLRNEPTEYPDLPYSVAFFRPNSGKKPSTLGMGELFSLEDDVRYLEDRMSHTLRMFDLWDNLPLVAKTRDGRQIQVDAVFGNTVNLTTEETLGFLQPTGNGPDHDKMIGLLQEAIQEGSYPPISYGVGNARSAGYAISMLSEQARIRLTQPIRQINLLYTLVFRKALALYRLYAPDKAIEAFGMYRGKRFVMNDLTGADTAGFHVDVQIVPNFPQDKQRNVALGNQIKALHGLSDRTIMEDYYGITDPDAEIERQGVEMFKMNPMLQQAILAEIAREYGFELPQPPGGGGGSPPREPISTPYMPNPTQGVDMNPAGQGSVMGDDQRIEQGMAQTQIAPGQLPWQG